MHVHPINFFYKTQRLLRDASLDCRAQIVVAKAVVMAPSPCDVAVGPLPVNLARILLESKLVLDRALVAPVKAGHPTRLQGFLQRCSPVTRLPPEILAYVFELYVACSRELPGQEGVALFQEPLCLMQVCTLWRAIAESDPHLWTSIRFHFPESHRSREEDVQRVQTVLDLRLKRSGVLPVSLTFTDDRMYHSATRGLISLLVDRVRTHAQRWKRISFRLAGGYFPLLSTFTPCDLSSLEELRINCNNSVFAQPITLHLDLKSATNLKSFSYSGPGPSVEDNIHLPWENLADVSFEFAPYHRGSFTFTPHRRFVDLSQCQNITTCSLGIDRPPRFATDRTITLPCLQTLRVRRVSRHAWAEGIIRPLILPRLHTLDIDASHLVTLNQRWHDRTFSDLLARSGCSLHHLSVQDVDFPDDELVRCLALAPALTSLRFLPCPRSQNTRSLVRSLDVSCIAVSGRARAEGHGGGHAATAGPLVPRLHEITLASSAEGYLDEMLTVFRSRAGGRARAAGVAALRRVQVIFFDLWHDRDAARVRGPGDGSRSGRAGGFQADLARWASENNHLDENRPDDGGDGLEASVVVDSPYLPEYIDVE